MFVVELLGKKYIYLTNYHSKNNCLEYLKKIMFVNFDNFYFVHIFIF